ncbi:hypothetical protein [Pararhodonellum marinum]|uniref:hypothetical protein n=1 Tax=Pararhodonellum marinum TaxID=2755358 RepID=UPI00188F1EAA|nr:hypothetical protein [Pararhodonellum marinum]
MQHFRLNQLFLLILASMIFSCGVPLPTDRTVVYASRDVGYYKFNPVKKEKYSGDTLIISNYLIAKTWTSSRFRGNKMREVQEDSILNLIANGMIKANINFKINPENKNIVRPEIILEDKHNWTKRIENNIFEFASEMDKEEGKHYIIPAILFRLIHNARSFNGPGAVNIDYFVFCIVFVFNDKMELIYKDQSGINAKSESIWEWEEALAFPIEDRVTEAHFEEMIREALREYISD